MNINLIPTNYSKSQSVQIDFDKIFNDKVKKQHRFRKRYSKLKNISLLSALKKLNIDLYDLLMANINQGGCGFFAYHMFNKLIELQQKNDLLKSKLKNIKLEIFEYKMNENDIEKNCLFIDYRLSEKEQILQLIKQQHLLGHIFVSFLYNKRKYYVDAYNLFHSTKLPSIFKKVEHNITIDFLKTIISFDEQNDFSPKVRWNYFFWKELYSPAFQNKEKFYSCKTYLKLKQIENLINSVAVAATIY